MLNRQTAIKSRFVVSWRIWSKINPAPVRLFDKDDCATMVSTDIAKFPISRPINGATKMGSAIRCWKTPDYLGHDDSSRSGLNTSPTR